MNASARAPAGMRDEHDKIVEEIMADCTIGHRNCVPSKEYLVRWHELLEAEISWESAKKLWQFEDLIWAYEAS